MCNYSPLCDFHKTEVHAFSSANIGDPRKLAGALELFDEKTGDDNANPIFHALRTSDGGKALVDFARLVCRQREGEMEATAMFDTLKAQYDAIDKDAAMAMFDTQFDSDTTNVGEWLVLRNSCDKITDKLEHVRCSSLKGKVEEICTTVHSHIALVVEHVLRGTCARALGKIRVASMTETRALTANLRRAYLRSTVDRLSADHSVFTVDHMDALDSWAAIGEQMVALLEVLHSQAQLDLGTKCVAALEVDILNLARECNVHEDEATAIQHEVISKSSAVERLRFSELKRGLINCIEHDAAEVSGASASEQLLTDLVQSVNDLRSKLPMTTAHAQPMLDGKRISSIGVIIDLLLKKSLMVSELTLAVEAVNNLEKWFAGSVGFERRARDVLELTDAENTQFEEQLAKWKSAIDLAKTSHAGKTKKKLMSSKFTKDVDGLLEKASLPVNAGSEEVNRFVTEMADLVDDIGNKTEHIKSQVDEAEASKKCGADVAEDVIGGLKKVV